MPSAISQIIKFINEKPVLRSWEDWLNFLFPAFAPQHPHQSAQQKPGEEAGKIQKYVLHLGAPVGDQLQGLVCDSHSQTGKSAVDEALGPWPPVQ